MSRLREFSALQKDLIVGTLLGNSTLQLLDFYPKKKVIMTITQEEDRLDYLKFLHLVMKPFTGLSEPKNFHVVDNKWSLEIAVGYEKYPNGFYTRPLTQLIPYFDLFYVKRDEIYVKILPQNISELVNPQGLAFWFMDTSLFLDNGLILRTESFLESEVFLLVNLLADKYGIKGIMFKYQESNKNNSISGEESKYRIMILDESFRILQEVVKSKIVRCMRPQFKL